MPCDGGAEYLVPAVDIKRVAKLDPPPPHIHVPEPTKGPLGNRELARQMEEEQARQRPVAMDEQLREARLITETEEVN